MQDIRRQVRPATISYTIAPDVELSDRDINSLTLSVVGNPPHVVPAPEIGASPGIQLCHTALLSKSNSCAVLPARRICGSLMENACRQSRDPGGPAQSGRPGRQAEDQRILARRLPLQPGEELKAPRNLLQDARGFVLDEVVLHTNPLGRL